MNEQYLWLKEQFKQHADDKKAKAMADYMRNQFCFYGISKPQRSAIYKQLLKVAKHNKRVDWNFLDLCYEDEHREFQYFVCDYLLAVQKYLTYEDINHIKHYIINKSWWDISDCLDNVIGAIGLCNHNVDSLMLAWSENENMWLRRVAIHYQLNRKENTNTELLANIIIHNLGSNQFFINKAIGTSLREYSKTNPEWVKNFITKYRHNMHKLSIKEASRYI